jgi:Tfp pilus assembly PilM family ATPase
MKLTRRSTGWIGIDAGGACVKTAQAVRRDGAFFIRAAAIVPRRERWTSETLAQAEPPSSADAMRAAASICGRLSGRAAAAVLPISLCETAQVEKNAVVRRAGDELAAIVEAETHQSLEGRLVASWPAVLQAGRVNVISAPVAWSDRLASDVAAGRWNCRALESLPWALARAAWMAEAPQPPATVAALDWGYARATLCLVHQGTPAIVRRLKDCGFGDFVSTIQKALRVNAHDAELLIERHGLANPDSERSAEAPSAIYDALADRLDELERELRRTLGYWQSQTRGTRPERMYLFGAGASLAGVDRRLSATLELDVRTWSLPSERSAAETTLPPSHLLGPALAASALAWEDQWSKA